MIAYITPNEFEQATEVCVINLETKQKTTVIEKGKPSPTDAVKWISWLDSDTLLVIIGYMYGTVSPGGAVYSVDVNTGEMKMLDIALEENEQIISIQPLGYEAIIEIAVFDESYENYNVKRDIFDMKFIDIPTTEYDENSAYTKAENKGDMPMLIVSPVTQDMLAEAIKQSTDVLSIDKKGDIFWVIPRYITTNGEVSAVSLVKIETVAYCEEEGKFLTDKVLYTAEVTDGFNMLIRAKAGGTEPTIKITVSIGADVYEHYM